MIRHDNINSIFQPKQFCDSESMIQHQCIGKWKLTSILLLNHLKKKNQLRSKARTLVSTAFIFAISFTKPEFHPEYVYFAVNYFGNTQCTYSRHLLHYVTQSGIVQRSSIVELEQS